MPTPGSLVRQFGLDEASVHVFISHSRVNSSWAFQLSDELRKRDVKTWLDVRDLAPGAQWEEGVVSAIQSAVGFVFVIGPEGPNDRWQTFEWQQVVDHEYYLDPAKPLIPVLIGAPEMPGFLKTRQPLVLDDAPGAVQKVAGQIEEALNNPASSVDEKKLELGREAQRQALQSLRDYSRELEEDDIKRAGIRALR
jgi:TIR domain